MSLKGNMSFADTIEATISIFSYNIYGMHLHNVIKMPSTLRWYLDMIVEMLLRKFNSSPYLYTHKLKILS